MRYLRTTLLFLATIAICLSSQAQDAYNIRQISNRDGLSNSAVICLFQDKERTLWAGTYDGLNKYDGVDIKIYKPDIRNPYSISGNVVRRIIESKDDYLWILTKGGLNKYSRKRDRVEACFTEFPENCVMACDTSGNLFIMTQLGQCSYYDFEEDKFKSITVPEFSPKTGWVGLSIDSEDNVWITGQGKIRRYAFDRSDNDELKLSRLSDLDHPHYITHVFNDRGLLVFVDSRSNVYLIKSGEKIFLQNIRSAIAEYGTVQALVLDGSDIIIGFRSNGGLIKLDHTDSYKVKKLPINCGVFSLFKDDDQDILWVGTDGQGIYACIKDRHIFKGINLDELPIKNRRPVRAIYTDRRGDMWLGTKGNGIIKISDYENAQEYDWTNVEHFTVEDGLCHDEVLSFEMSSAHNVLWIGSAGPRIHYYSFDDNRIHTLQTDIPFNTAEVHSIVETNDSTLWVSSLFSLIQIDIYKKGDELHARRFRWHEFDITNKHLFNKVYALRQENDSIMWVAMRGNGAIRFNCQTGTHRIITVDEQGIAPMNDILSVLIAGNKDIWFGTSYGINHLSQNGDGSFEYRNYNESDGLSNNTIHGILENRNGKLWLSSNSGIILFDPVKRTFRNFNRKTGLKVIEFSDNAYYKDEVTTKYFFGGIDGVIWIEHTDKEKNDFTPPIYFSKLRILNEEVNIDDFFVSDKKRDHLKLKHNQNFFTVSFSANDFIEGSSIKFSYMLENFNNVWMNTNSREAPFTNIHPGDYVLKVKYDSESDMGSQVASLNIRILPPWYFSIYAKLFYLVAALGLLGLFYLYITKRHERRKAVMAQQLDQKYKEEMYENKLRFFTNITHEFCTPLTLIHTPSERIINYKGSDEYVKKYARTIRSNSERLNTLIQEIIDFRRMETGNKTCKIESCDINKICRDIADAFNDLAEENGIDFSLDIKPGITWNTDRTLINTILNNLLSNAFKYTPEKGSIKLSVDVEEDQLVLNVFNTGKGIREKDLPYMFNRYTVLDNVKENSIKGLSSRNGLGLAICKSMVDQLEGEIDIRSQVGEYAEFIVKLPVREPAKTETTDTGIANVVPDNLPESSSPDEFTDTAVVKSGHDEISVEKADGRPKILIIDDNEEIREMLKDIFSGEYHVYTAVNGKEGFEQLTDRMPDLVITDIMMPDQDGISLTKQIKTNPHTMHIPVVIVSAKSAIDDKIEGVESGADAYISKPFNTQYLGTVVKQLIDKHKKLRNYYNSSASSFDYLNGRLLPKEDRLLIESAINIIDQNIGDVEFTPEDLAYEMGLSLRSLYRKFKELEFLPLKDFIKKQRIEYSAKLLISTNLTIQEIMYSAGFTTRSHFYNEFSKRYNQTPKEYRETRAAEIDEFTKKD